MRSFSYIGPLLYVSFYFALLGIIAYDYWRRFKEDGAAKAFNFRITDIWAATVALTPTFVIASFIITENDHRGWQRGDELGTTALLLVLAGSQVVGLLIGRVHVELPPHRGARSACASAISIVAGGLIGLLFPSAFVFVALYPVLLPLFLVAIYYAFLRRWVNGAVDK